MQLENDAIRVALDDRTGAVVSLLNKATGTELIAEPRLAENFRVLLPIPDLQCNYIRGTEQPLAAARQSGSGFELRWDGPLVNEHGRFDLDVTLWVELAGPAVQFRCQVRNRTQHDIAEVWFAMLGGLMGLGHGDEARDTKLLVPYSNTGWRQDLFRDFGNTRGQTLGVPGGEHSFSYPGYMSMPWVSLYHPGRDEGLYFAALEDAPRVKAVCFSLDCLAQDRPSGNWPRKEEIGDLPLGVRMSWVHFPYTRPGRTFSSATVQLQFHRGDWRGSAELYRQWFTARHKPIPPGSTWIRRDTACMHTMFMLPEDNINVRFKDIPAWARSAADHDVGHVMIAGWNVGGHDRGYPYYQPDPRLGTWEELQAGVRACHDLGLHVSFFVNCQPVDMSTEWYKRELHKYRFQDRHGQLYFVINYWGMGTLGARSRFTATPFCEINPAHPQVRELLIRQLRRLVEIGADGLHIDKFFQHSFDFNPLLGDASPDLAQHEGCLRFIEELLAAGRAINPHFCVSFEGNWDRLLAYADTIWWGGGEDIPLKEAFPQVALIAGIEQPFDFNRVNRAVLQGQNLLIGPANYCRDMNYPPMRELADYIGQVTRIRRELFDIVSLGRKLDASDGLYQCRPATLRLAEPFAASPLARWSVFRDARTGRRAAILANFSPGPLELADLALEGNADGPCRVYQPGQSTQPARFPLSLRLPAERLAFVVEE